MARYSVSHKLKEKCVELEKTLEGAEKAINFLLAVCYGVILAAIFFIGYLLIRVSGLE